VPVRVTSAMRLIAATVVLLATVALVLWQTHEVPRPHRIGLLSPGSATQQGPNTEAFFNVLRERGYVEGQNLVIERRYGDGREDRLASAARELAGLDLDVIVAFGPAASKAAMQATSTVPIVMSSFDAVEQGLVASLRHPGGNVTGWSIQSSETGGKQLAQLKEAFPAISRVAVVFNPTMPGHAELIRKLGDDAKRLGLELYPVKVSSADQLADAFAVMRDKGLEAFFVIPEPAVIDQLRGRMVALAAENHIPAMYPFRMYVDAGGLMSYGPSLRDLLGRSADFVDRILKGAKPADIPVEQPDKYELVLNAKTAQALGVTFPAALRAYAHEIVE